MRCEEETRERTAEMALSLLCHGPPMDVATLASCTRFKQILHDVDGFLDGLAIKDLRRKVDGGKRTEFQKWIKGHTTWTHLMGISLWDSGLLVCLFCTSNSYLAFAGLMLYC